MSATCVYLASDHAGFEMKKALVAYLRERGYECVEDLGDATLDPADDYPDFVMPLARKVVSEPGSFGIILGASGQGEAMAANRIRGARAAVYYGPAPKLQVDEDDEKLDIIASSRNHNDANILSFGARFISIEDAQRVAELWLSTAFSGDERHQRRIAKLDETSHASEHHAKS